jgi:hypothetical protein
MDDLVALRKAAGSARNSLERWGMINTVGQTPEDLVKIDLEYRRAMRRYDEACRAYNDAIERAI